MRKLITLHIGRGLALYRPAIRFSAFLSWVSGLDMLQPGRIDLPGHPRVPFQGEGLHPLDAEERCRGCVVGLQVGGEVLGEALLGDVASVAGGASWAFGSVTPYLRRLPHVLGRGMSSPMPEAPCGTLTPVRDWDAFV